MRRSNLQHKCGKTGKGGRARAGVGELHRSFALADIKTAGARRAGTCPPAPQRGEGLDDGWGDELWIKTSPKVRKRQRVLYLKAKAEPRWRFYRLYGELYRQDVLSAALDQVMENTVVPGVDGFKLETLAKIRRHGQFGGTRWRRNCGRRLIARARCGASISGTIRPP